MINWLLGFLKSKNLKKDKNYNSANSCESQATNISKNDVSNDVKDDYKDISKDNIKDDVEVASKDILEYKKEPCEISEPTVTTVEEKDSIYKMHASRVFYDSYEACCLSSYDIKGYTKYISTEVAGPHHHVRELYDLFNIIKDKDIISISAYCEKEPDNIYDVNAAKVLVDVMDDYCDVKTFHIGYLPREIAECFKNIDEIPIVVKFIKLSKFTDVHIDVYAENAVCQRAIEEEKRLLEIKSRYDDNKSEIDKLISDGDILEKDGFVEEAMEKFKQALDLDCVMPHPANRLAIYYRKKRDYESEIAVISKFLKQNVYRLGWEYYEERLGKAKDLRQRQIDRELALAEKTRMKEEKEKLRKLKDLEAETKKKKIQSKKDQNKNSSSKVCNCCKQEKSLEHFNKNGKDSKGNTVYRSRCKECIKAHKR